MKKTILTILISLFSFVGLFAQNHEITLKDHKKDYVKIKYKYAYLYEEGKDVLSKEGTNILEFSPYFVIIYSDNVKLTFRTLSIEKIGEANYKGDLASVDIQGIFQYEFDIESFTLIFPDGTRSKMYNPVSKLSLND